jgi:NAD(P)-dependent dehydrogenase (short-subunit alcohol dehydrogenase family)
VLVSRSQEKLQAALSYLGNYAQNARAFSADVTDSGQVNLLLESVLAHEKRIDVLVNNLGQGMRKQLVETTDADWEHLVSVNLTSAVYVSRAVLPIMRQQKSGKIINIASRAGRRGEGDFTAYSALKHGLIGLSCALADSESPYGIKVNAVCPGPVSTQKMLERYPNLDVSSWSTPEDVAQTVLFLLSKPAETMTGQVIDLFNN